MRDKEVRNELTLEVYYTGPAVEDHTIPVRAYATSLLGFADAIDEYVNLNYPMNDINVDIKAQKEGSFDVILQMVQMVPALVDAFGGTIEVADIATIGKGILETIKVFKDRVEATGSALPGAKETVEQHERHIDVDFGNGKKFHYSNESYRSSKSKSLAKSLGDAANPANREGFDPIRFSIPSEQRDITLGGHEATVLIDPKIPDQQVKPDISETTLQIQVIQRGSKKWKFRQGDDTFFATILDNEFLDKFTNREIPYYNGDMLKVRLQTDLKVIDGTLKPVKRTILKVLDYIPLESPKTFEGM